MEKNMETTTLLSGLGFRVSGLSVTGGGFGGFGFMLCQDES